MPTAIAVTSADLVLPAPDRHTPGAAVLRPSGEADLEASLAETTALLERHGHLLVVVPPWLPAAVTRRLYTVRAILESDRIALLDIDLPPLGVAVLVRQLRQLTVCDFSPGVIASAARLLSHYVYAGALLGTVAKLDRVPVGLKAHARSWSPSAQFAVLAHPQPHLARLGAAPAPGASVLPPGPTFATHLTFARGQLTSDWVTAELAPAWQVQGVMENPLPADSAGWWATPKLVEFAAAIPDVSVLYQLVASVRRERCRWCGLELIGDRCGFCAAPLAPPPAAPPHATAPHATAPSASPVSSGARAHARTRSRSRS
ncbi:hypothetical protein [Streptomyces sp. RerS4]|uniref:hypothetical protein n=1 Tax=Streptomyces sp. RerS4 TaxID=2942449 RepID=UPI00201C5A48|nr:hypothetical protein [Streptomyces sp. RerS4]UQX02733.1 hypothetical protein M4D82_21260 [Streptomyces sp. RerS4]